MFMVDIELFNVVYFYNNYIVVISKISKKEVAYDHIIHNMNSTLTERVNCYLIQKDSVI